MTYATKTPMLRLAAFAFAGALAATAISANATERNPSDQVPNWISESNFAAMDDYDIYEIDHAQKLGERVLIGGHSASESRELVDEALSSNTVSRELTSFETPSLDHLDAKQGPRGR
ncbi:hypothetical protein KPG71_05955 [Roseovarius sp. PS-C2]|uniref:hypothetical protein n=1 Tax=Roseovarius sp. PS-C2 TaxID=2820814 RepID=UPI001C0E4C24|nr:hypothetical protein [Roseovarius sp. PS-C2]MBU3259555.1 hypothetical protein [Roseovarius sp. PS-C2]